MEVLLIVGDDITYDVCDYGGFISDQQHSIVVHSIASFAISVLVIECWVDCIPAFIVPLIFTDYNATISFQFFRGYI